MTDRLPVHCTARERAVASMLATGHQPAVIARRLSIAERTVRSHVHNLAARIPGDLPPIARVIVWWRGAPHEVLG